MGVASGAFDSMDDVAVCKVLVGLTEGLRAETLVFREVSSKMA